MSETQDAWWAREIALRQRVLGYVVTHLGDAQVHTAADGFTELLADAPEQMVEDLLSLIFTWSDYWPKQIATEILGWSEDEEYQWEELLDGFEAMERRDRPEDPEGRSEGSEGSDDEGHDPQKAVWTGQWPNLPEAATTTRRRYAEVAWCIEDITSRYQASPEEARRLLAGIEKRLEEAMVIQGWDFIDQAARERGFEEKDDDEDQDDEDGPWKAPQAV